MNENHNHINKDHGIGQISLNRLIDSMLGLLIALLILYTIWYQYAVNVVDGMLPLLGAACMMLAVFKMFPSIDLLQYSKLAYIIVYVVLFGILGFATAKYPNKFNDVFFSMVVYLIPPIAIVAYVDQDKAKLRKVLMAVALATTLLAISSFTQGVSTDTNAITVGDYNTNALSNCIVFGCFCLLILWLDAKKILSKIILIAAMIVGVISQILVASRRGVLVHACLFVFFFLSINTIKKRKNNALKWIIVILIVMIVVSVCINLYGEFFSTLTIVDRFLGTNESTASGDSLRERYQAAALQMFWDRPIFGNGFGSVSGEVGAYSHSLYYETLACTGLIGFSIIMCMFLNYIYVFKKSSARSSGRDTTTKLISRMSMWFCICVLISGIAVVFIYDMVFYCTIGVLIGTLNCYCRQTSVEEPMM